MSGLHAKPGFPYRTGYADLALASGLGIWGVPPGFGHAHGRVLASAAICVWGGAASLHSEGAAQGDLPIGAVQVT